MTDFQESKHKTVTAAMAACMILVLGPAACSSMSEGGAGSPDSGALADASSSSIDGSAVLIPVDGEEQRCTELGGACACSEPLSALGVDLDVERDKASQHNPPDSTTRQCNGGYSVGTASGLVSVSPPPNMPKGATTPSVYELRSHTGNVNTVFGNTVPAGTRRFCMRIYHLLSDDHPITCAPSNDCACDRIKNTQIVVGDNLVMQSSWVDGATSKVHGRVFDSSGTPLIEDQNFTPVSGEKVTQDEVNGHWYRTEFCMSGELGVESGQVTKMEYRIAVPDLGKEELRVRQGGLPVEGADTRIDDVWIGNLYRQGNCSPGKRYAAFAMQAHWTTDEDQWIGPAAEMEGF